MKKFWFLYSFLPVCLVSISLLFGFAGRSAAAPGIEVQEKVLFSVLPDTPDPNEVLRLVNAERTKYGLPELQADKTLGKVAALRAADMNEGSYYAHKNPDGRYYFHYFKDVNLKSGYSCENLDLILVPDESVAVREWQASLRGHRECMFDQRPTKAGYAVVKLDANNQVKSDASAYVVVAIHAQVL